MSRNAKRKMKNAAGVLQVLLHTDSYSIPGVGYTQTKRQEQKPAGRQDPQGFLNLLKFLNYSHFKRSSYTAVGCSKQCIFERPYRHNLWSKCKQRNRTGTTGFNPKKTDGAFTCWTNT